MSDTAATLEGLVLERLADADLPGAVADLVVAALLGDDELGHALASDGYTRPEATTDPAAGEPVGTYLNAVIVSGFRGIGAEAALRLRPGPGLTLITGRNGSGKSSFADAVELAMTGDNKRWSGRTSVWREGWRNLHAPEPCRITVQLAVDGQAGTTTLVREWAAGANLDDATAHVQQHGRTRAAVDTLGWARPLEVYRPFLSYAELGTLMDGRPSEMYDALQAILGLDQLVDAERRLADARKRLEETVKQARLELPPLLQRLQTHPDERAERAAAALAGKRWELDTVEAVAVAPTAADASLLGRLQRIATVTLPEPATVTRALTALQATRKRVAALAGTPAATARRLAGLLTTALAHHAEHPGQPCPVCAGRMLDHTWATATQAEVERLTGLARDAEQTHGEFAAAVRTVRGLVSAMPPLLAGPLGPDVDPGPTRAAWQRWAAIASAADLDTLTGEVEPAYTAVAQALATLQAAAAAVVQRRHTAWQPLAAELAGWLRSARLAQRAEAPLAQVKQAVGWLKIAGQEIRDLRLAPFAALSAQVWETLRQESNVELGPIRLEGATTRRRVSLDVTVDGVEGAALGVMSQGELHALGLALFLPRATAADSPFGFLVIDDPVQSMDPAKVDGLARVLHQVAQTRQVVVFTHDDRLAEALRRLQLPATIWEVVRRESSVVELRKNDDPVRRYIDDARALARTSELPADVRAVVVAGFCRSAVEAACQDVVRARQLARGVPHAEVERALMTAQTLHQTAALALFDDIARGDQVIARLNRDVGRWAGDAFVAVKAGIHTAHAGDLAGLVEDIARLADRLRA